MVPIYSVVSFLSYYFYTRAVYFEVIRDCYEAFAIASFFSLLCAYIEPDLHSQKDYFRRIQPRGWVLPINYFKKCCGGELGIWRTPRSGLTWFNIIWFGVFQYCFVRVFMTLVAVITQAAGRYCLDSVSPAFAHVWVMVIEGGCVTVAMYCLIQFYIQLRHDLAEHSPFLKVVAIKLVIFLSFWQTFVISSITSTGIIKASNRIKTPDIKIGIPSMLLCIEMAIFSVFHLWAFPWRVYDVRRSQIVASESAAGFFPDPKTAYRGGAFGSKALMDAFNPWDIIKAVGRGFKWFMVGRKTRMEDISYKNTAQGTGLESTRNQITAFETATHSFDGASGPPHPFAQGGKPGRYHPLSEEEDSDRLLAHAQSNPEAPYPRPMERLPHLNGGGDMGTMGVYDPPNPRAQAYPTTRHQEPGQEYEVTDERSLEEQDTGYHGARRRATPVPPPDPHPLGPPGGRSNEDEWSMWGGARENERDLGGGHGVGDNRF